MVSSLSLVLNHLQPIFSWRNYCDFSTIKQRNISGVSYFDEPGLIGKIPKQNKPVFLYSLVQKIEGTSTLSIGKMVSRFQLGHDPGTSV